MFKKICFLGFVLITFVSCVNNELYFANNYYRFSDFEDKDFIYVKKPLDSKVNIDENLEQLNFSFLNCDVYLEKGYKFMDNELDTYSVYNSNYDYIIYTTNVDLCRKYVDEMGGSLTDKNYFESSEYKFRVLLRYDFENTILPGNAGVKMVQYSADGNLEVQIFANENSKSYLSLVDFVSENFVGYNYEYKDFGNFSGFLVDESFDKEAKRTFFVLSNDRDFIYEISVTMPREKYSLYADFIFDILNGIEFL